MLTVEGRRKMFAIDDPLTLAVTINLVQSFARKSNRSTLDFSGILDPIGFQEDFFLRNVRP